LTFAGQKPATQDILISYRDVTMSVMLLLLLQMKVCNSYFIVSLCEEKLEHTDLLPFTPKSEKSNFHILLFEKQLGFLVNEEVLTTTLKFMK